MLEFIRNFLKKEKNMFQELASAVIYSANNKIVFVEMNSGTYMDRKNETGHTTRLHILDNTNDTNIVGKTGIAALKGFQTGYIFQKGDKFPKEIYKAVGTKSQKEFYLNAKDLSLFFKDGKICILPTDSNGKGFFALEHLPNWGKITVTELTEEKIGEAIIQALSIARNKAERERDLALGKK